MDLPINAYPKIGNKVLVALSGLNRNSKLDEGGYKYDRHYYHISDRFLSLRWSKSLIKQLVLYIACTNSHGSITLISENEMASLMNVSTRTVRHNNRLLTHAGILSWDRILSDVITVSFSHYFYDIIGIEKLSETEKEDRSTGYTTLEKESVLKLMKEEDVNVLRATLRFFVLSETQLNPDGHQTELHIFFKDLTNFLPHYVGYKSKIKAIVDKIRVFFPFDVIEGTEAVYSFLKKQRLSKTILEKSKNGLIYLLKKEAFKPASVKHEEESRLLFMYYQNVINRADNSHILIKNTELSFYKDDAEALITSFGINKLDQALKRVHALMSKSTHDKKGITLEELASLNQFYANPSRGLRFITEQIA